MAKFKEMKNRETAMAQSGKCQYEATDTLELQVSTQQQNISWFRGLDFQVWRSVSTIKININPLSRKRLTD
jgi:hypothetical protein